jgi:hypothetical protein
MGPLGFEPRPMEMSPANSHFVFFKNRSIYYLIGRLGCGLRFVHAVLNSAISETFLSKFLLNIGKY